MAVPIGKPIQLVAALALIGSAITVVFIQLTSSSAPTGPDVRSQSRTTQDIATQVALALDRGDDDRLQAALSDTLSNHADVRALDVIVTDDDRRLLSIGPVESLQSKIDAGSSEVRRVTLLRDGGPWGEVRILFKPAIRSVIPGDRGYYAMVALAVLVLPLTVALVERVRRRLDKSPDGPMAVAADRARHTLDTLVEGVLLLDTEGRIVFANHAFCESAESTQSDLVGKSISELRWVIPGGPEAQHPFPWVTVSAQHNSVCGVRICLRRAASSLTFITNCTPLFRKPGVLHGVLVTFDDVTELEDHRIALQDARDDAHRANEAKSRFLAMMSHEIRTPLNGVSGTLQLLKKTSLESRQSQYVDAAAFSASTLLHLINDVLDLSKIEAGQMELSPIEFDLEECVDRIMLMMAQPARAKNLCLAYHIDAAVAPRFVGDPDRIRQVIINLTNNAIKFTERGSVSLRISVQEDFARRQTIKCAVADTGIGIPEHKIHRLFKAFSQVDSSTTRRYGGTGLGLVISKQLCELMGGRIEVASKEGSGTTFTFYLDLPLADSLISEEPGPGLVDAQTRAIFIGLHQMEIEVAAAALHVPASHALVLDDVSGVISHALPTGWNEPGPIVAIVAVANSADLSLAVTRIRTALGREDIQVIGAACGHDVQRPADVKGLCSVVHRPIGARRLRDAVLTASPDLAPAVSNTRENTASPKSLVGLKILLAEDNTVGQMVVSDMIRGAGAICDIAADGREVLAAVQRQTYDVILMDCFMPEVDGFAATRQIREWQQQGKLPQRIPIIALTAKAMRGDREDCLEAGMDGYVTKPVEENELLAAITAQAGRTAEAATPAAEAPSPIRVDVNKLHDRYRNKMELLFKLIEAFKSVCAEDMARIATAIQQRNASELEQASHRLAGSAGFVSANVVRHLAVDLEHRASDHRLEDLSETVEKMRREIDQTIVELDNCIATGFKPASTNPCVEKEVTQ